MNQMIEKLKTTLTEFGNLSNEEKAFLLSHIESAIRIRHDFSIEPARATLWNIGVYRLRPDFVKVADVRYYWCTRDNMVHERTAGTCWDESDCCTEITADQKAYLENKPAAEEGFEWVLKVPEFKKRYLSLDYEEIGCVTGPGCELNRIRWTKVPVVSLRDAAQSCSECNWTNTSLLNLGDVGKPRWVCHGCCKRAIEAKDAAQRAVDAYKRKIECEPFSDVPLDEAMPEAQKLQRNDWS